MCQVSEINTFEEAKQYINLLTKLYKDNKDEDVLLSDLEEMFATYHYRLLVATIDQKPIGICGISFNKLLYVGKFIQISNLFVLPEHRKSGIAGQLIKKAKEIAKQNNIKKIMLDSYVDNTDAHKTYFREDFYLEAFHFALDLQ